MNENATARRTRAWMEIDLGAIERNLRAFRRHIGEDAKVCAVIQADGYGHGAIPVARRLFAGPSAGAAWGAAADLREGIEIRQSGITAPILLLGALAPPEYGDAAAHDLTISLHSAADVDRARDAAAKAGRRVRVHLKIDTGMARLGAPPSEVVAIAGRIRSAPGLEFEGLFTHFSSAGSMDKGAMREQLVAFRGAVDRLEKAGLRPPLLHAANSAAALAFPETRFNLVRPGIVLYGVDPGGFCARLGWRPEPAMALRARIAHVKPVACERTVGYERRWRATQDTRLATVPLGYADGYPFALTNTGSALVRGRRVPVVGSVTMDYVMLDTGAVPEVQEGDVATFIGRDGAEEIRVEDVASRASTIPYDILCGIGRRVERVYL